MIIINKISSNKDDVIKYVFKNSSQIPIEASLIRKGDGKDIVCVPAQTNCKMGCQFCHLTGINMPAKNLSYHEIIDIIYAIIKDSSRRNNTLLVSYMGAGEPLLNIDNIINSMTILSKMDIYPNIKFGVSTLIPRLENFLDFTELVKEFNLPVKLHWSLHAVNESNRKTLMPRALSISGAAALLQHYQERTKRPIEIHYTLINKINDTENDLQNFDKLISKQFPIKLLKFSPRTDSDLLGSDQTEWFAQELIKLGFQVEIYAPPGEDIGAACGQFDIQKYR